MWGIYWSEVFITARAFIGVRYLFQPGHFFGVRYLSHVGHLLE